MMKIFFALTLCCWIVPCVQADPQNLQGGALIAHYVPELLYTESPDDACADYAPYAITHHSQQVNRIDTGDSLQATWFVIAAWCEEKEFCGFMFGFSGYDPEIFEFLAWGPCLGLSGGLEIPSHGWPGPMEGTLCVTGGDPWVGNYVPIYYFHGYAFGDVDPGVIQIIPDPTVGIHPEVGNCASPPNAWFTQDGGIGINMEGIYVAPLPPSPVEHESWGGIKDLYR